ncbi:MAG TPA: polymorphic toxin-type HINT domain-containing protein [Micromonospora sp.]|nr:polymorphic toxin-type HINT domain-containing protein [Micromonospora sp.]
MVALTAALLQPAGPSQAAQAQIGPVPQVTAGPGPVDRPAPASARPDEAVPEEKLPPPVPAGVPVQGAPEQLAPEQWAAVPKPGKAALTAAADEVFTNVLLRPGYVLGDTSLVAYFDVRDEDPAWTSWEVRLYDVESKTEQASTLLPRSALQAECGGASEYCRSFGVADGWVLDAAKEYFITIAAFFEDGREEESAASAEAKPRTTVTPPSIPASQAAGCGCGTALGMDVRQAVRGIGVNTATGAFSRVEPDVSMASFGIPFASTRVYSSANPSAGPFGPGWAWSYGMRVTGSEEGAVVRADDGAEVLYRLEDGAYVRPPGVRSKLRKTDDGWELVTLRQIVYAFDAQGRLVAIRDPRGVGVSLAYTSAGITITDPSDRVVEVRISGGLIRSILLPDQRKVQYEYDGQGRLTVYKDARSRQWRYTYSAAGLLTEVIDPQPDRVVLFRTEYNSAGRVVRQTDAIGKVTRFEWDADEQVAKTTDADGVVVRDGYRDNVLLYSRRGNGDTDTHRYDGSLNRNLVVDSKQNQHEAEFDAAGNPIIRTAPQGFTEKTKYDARNNPIEFVDASGNLWKNTYNEFNELAESVDAEGHKITYAYDARGLLLTRTDQRGKVTRYEYIPTGQANSGLLQAVISPEGRRAEFGYDATGRRASTVDPRGTVAGADRKAFTTHYTFDEQDRVLTVLEPGKEHVWSSTYDEVGRIRTQVDPMQAEVSYTYLDNGLLAAIADPRRTTSFTYTDAGRRASTRVEMAGQGPDIVTTYQYNVKGLLHKVTSPRGNVPGANPDDFTTIYRYDGNDNLVRISRPYPGGEMVHKDFKVDELDRTTATTDESNKTATFDRNNTGNVTGTTDTLGRSVSMTYDRNGRQTGITNAGTNTSRFTYDEAGNKIRAENATGGVTTWTYSDDGLLASVTEPRGNVEGADRERFTTHFEYDPAANQTKVIDPLDHVTVSTYDANNRLTSTTDATGRTTHYTYREDDQVEAVHAPDAPFTPDAPHNNATVYGYHKDGLLATVRDPHQRVTRLDYDRAGRLTAKIDPLHRRVELGYDTENNLVSAFTRWENESLSAADRASRTITDTYDIAGRRVQRTLGSEGPVYKWGYDAKDRITAYGDPTGVREVTYDDEDQITKVVRKEAGGRTETFGYEYDVRGNITNRTYPDGTSVAAGYDADSRMTQLTVVGGAAGAEPATWKFGYDIAGNRTSTTLPEATGLIERRGYDNAGRLTSIGTTRADGRAPPAGVQDPISSFELDLDEVGNPTRVVTTRGGVSESVAYAYDPVDRVTSACYAATTCGPNAAAAGRIDYTYDLVGNRTSQKRTGTAGADTTIYQYDVADQLIKETVTTGSGSTVNEYGYDLNGNQTKAGADTFTYNLNNTLATATVNGSTARFAYDATGLRLSATVGEGEAATTQRWSWDVVGSLPQIALDTATDAAGNILEKQGFTYGPDDEPLALLAPGNGAYSYTHDWLGGVANILTPGGAPAAGYDYDPFGNPRIGDTLAQAIAGPPAPGSPGALAARNPLRFTGAYQDSSTGEGNYYLRARNYNPGTGRFTAVDPMPMGASATSAYVYADNNPLAYTDPTGAHPEGGPPQTGQEPDPGPSPEDMAKAQQIQSKSLLDVVLEAGGQILMEFLGINDIIDCLGGDLGACVTMVIGSLPWGKIFKAKKIAEAIFRAGKAVVTFFQELKWARAIIRGAERAAEAAKKAAAEAARKAAEKAAKARELAEREARKAAAAAAARAKALAAKAKAATKRGGPDGCKHSFVAGTRVLLADGSSKPIEQVKPGETVVATDPTTGRTESRQVTHTIRTDDDKDYVDLTIRDADGKRQTITSTDNHPFWSVNREDWVDAGELKPGELLRTSAGTYVQVDALRPYQAKRITYDLTVDAIHTYYVFAGHEPVLVHNCNPGTKFDVPDGPGVYTIHLNDGRKYVGSSTDSMRSRVNKSMRSKHAVRKAGYNKDDVVNVTWIDLPSAMDSEAVRRVEQTVMEGLKDLGVSLVNRRDPEIRIPFGGYF